jgi:hypothetical protein
LPPPAAFNDLGEWLVGAGVAAVVATARMRL